MESGEPKPYQPPQAELTGSEEGYGSDSAFPPVPFEDVDGQPRFWPRVWGMFRLLFTDPAALADRVPSTEGLGAPLRFALLLAAPMMLLFLVAFGLLGGLMGMTLIAEGRGNAEAPTWIFALLGPGYAIFLALMIVIGVPVGGVVLHGSLWLWGGTRQGRGIGQTLRLCGYYTAFYMLGSLVPVLNMAVALGGPAFLGMGLARIHRTETWRGIVAAYTPMAVCCCLYALLFVVLAGVGALK